MAAKPTISDVAARAGVSKGAVSFALNGRPGVSPDTRERILRAADELGFVRNATAHALSSRRSNSLGVVIARNFATMRSDPFFPPFIAGVESVIGPSGQLLVVRLVADRNAEVAAYEELSKTGRVDGVFVTDIRADDERPALLAALGLPAVTLNRPLVPSSAPAVCMDDRPAVRDATEHLVGLGHRRIGHVGGPSRYLHAVERRQVWADVLRQHDLSDDLWVEADFSAAGGAAATRQLLDQPDPPTAILYASDLMAVAGFAIAHQRGLRIPHDLSVVGFDDGELSEHLSTPLATVRTDAYGWGRAAATALQSFIKGEAVQDVHLPAAQFIERESTGPAPQHDNQRPAIHR